MKKKKRNTLMIYDTSIIKDGHEYFLVKIDDREDFGLKEPSFMGMKGYALKYVKKIVNK